jgi:sec-independent protein translocase protein TatA
MGLGWTEVLVIALLVVVLFGARRLPEIGKSLGSGIREFKKSVSGEGEKEKQIEEYKPPKPQSLESKKDSSKSDSDPE